MKWLCRRGSSIFRLLAIVCLFSIAPVAPQGAFGINVSAQEELPDTSVEGSSAASSKLAKSGALRHRTGLPTPIEDSHPAGSSTGVEPQRKLAQPAHLMRGSGYGPASRLPVHLVCSVLLI
jgi:hypothetical protein